MSDQAILQTQSASGNWREIGRCSNTPQIMALRLDEAKAKYKMPVRAVDGMGRLLDIR